MRTRTNPPPDATAAYRSKARQVAEIMATMGARDRIHSQIDSFSTATLEAHEEEIKELLRDLVTRLVRSAPPKRRSSLRLLQGGHDVPATR